MGEVSGGMYGYASLLIGGLVAVAVAWISRARQEPEPDLTTIAGLAEEMVRQRNRVDALESEQQQDRLRIAAFSRYMATLQDALRRHGLPVPDPTTEDEPLIRG